eukprot:TRINITY_DN10003_c0_g1_i1.p1 TRINITY_DN10003_c0_g1~~TRINITY_DN10003_c0_g1_i1.p1  ORF type:complete len:476 (+),score=138.58 TRINITY_DN10003_c0_g1_i1:181-1608(+)
MEFFNFLKENVAPLFLDDLRLQKPEGKSDERDRNGQRSRSQGSSASSSENYSSSDDSDEGFQSLDITSDEEGNPSTPKNLVSASRQQAASDDLDGLPDLSRLRISSPSSSPKKVEQLQPQAPPPVHPSPLSKTNSSQPTPDRPSPIHYRRRKTEESEEAVPLQPSPLRTKSERLKEKSRLKTKEKETKEKEREKRRNSIVQQQPLQLQPQQSKQKELPSNSRPLLKREPRRSRHKIQVEDEEEDEEDYVSSVLDGQIGSRLDKLNRDIQDSRRSSSSHAINRDHLKQMIEMGFSSSAAQRALIATRNRSLDLAVEYLFNHPELDKSMKMNDSTKKEQAGDVPIPPSNSVFLTKGTKDSSSSPPKSLESQLEEEREKNSRLEILLDEDRRTMRALRLQLHQLVQQQDGSNSSSSSSSHHTKTSVSFCVVCEEVPVEIALIPCGHLCACTECSLKFKQPQCPICRTPFTSTLRTYPI